MFEERYKEWILKGLEGAINLLEHLKRDGLLNLKDQNALNDILDDCQIDYTELGYTNFFKILQILYCISSRFEKEYTEEELKRHKTCLQRLEEYAR